MARTPDGPPPPPAVQKLRIRYAKRARLRFASHRDFQRALERALRRAQVPMAYSAGFSPHPKVSYANAAPTGAASEAEYLEISVVERVDPDTLRTALDDALPAGLDVVEVVEAGPGALADRLTGGWWELVLPGVAPDVAEAGVAALLARDSVEVQRLTKNGRRTLDARSAVVRLGVVEPAAAASDLGRAAVASGRVCAILHLVVRHATPAVRPDDVLTALSAVADLAPESPPQVTRLAQGPLDAEDGTVADPLAGDRTPPASEPTRAPTETAGSANAGT
ncbi:MAG TPA: TIGR03936 family radical SAM-associated protein [Actinomycetales bacterium]|nr:TIGR03936 family radical SAM-associated protein [Actinomycetales bacterium]